MKVAIVYNLFRPDTMGIYFRRAFEQLGIVCDHYWTRDASKIPPHYDLYFRVDDDWYELDIPGNLRPRVLWANDVHLPASFKNLMRIARFYNFVFTPSTIAEQDFKRRGIRAYWMSQGCDPEIHKKLDVSKKYDIAFVGTEGGIPRKFYLQELRERYPRSFIGQAPYTQMSELYSQAKIGFNFAIKHEYFVMRCYEVLSCGTMLLMHRMIDESTERLGYRDGIHYVEFNSPAEMFGKVEYYLTHDREREKIAQTGHEFTVKKHRYIDRVRLMLDIMGFASF